MTTRNLLQTRETPKQARGRKTVDAILTATAQLLDEVGIEKLSTNLVCARAGLAPPSLYRFFPSKYAILKVLADQLMVAQNTALLASTIDLSDLTGSVFSALKGQLDVTLAFTGGPMLMRSLHAVPVLRDVRLTSHQRATDAVLAIYRELVPEMPEAALRRRVRLIIEMGYATLEYAFDAPVEARQKILEDASRMLALYHRDVLGDARVSVTSLTRV